MESTRLLTIPASPEAPARARTAVAEVLGAGHPRLEAAMLATSEIVSNAIQHGELDPGDSILLEIDRPRGRTRVTVSHPGTFSGTHRSEPGPGGWGLKIVNRVSRHWGIDRDRDRVRAWFEIQPSA